MSSRCSTPETICLQCGDRGFTNAFVYCVQCLKVAVHRYCLIIIPNTVDEFVRWVCDDCDAKVPAVECKARDHSTYKRLQGTTTSLKRKTTEDGTSDPHMNEKRTKEKHDKENKKKGQQKSATSKQAEQVEEDDRELDEENNEEENLGQEKEGGEEEKKEKVAEEGEEEEQNERRVHEEEQEPPTQSVEQEDKEEFIDKYFRPFESYRPLKNRTSPTVLVEAIQRLTPIQRQEVIDMGFGALLHLKLRDIPLRMGYWLLDNFNTNRSEITGIEQGSLHVDEESVRHILGLPRGSTIITSRIKNTASPMTDLWKKRFNKSSIKSRDILDDMVNEANGGEWFKRQFLVLVTCCLIESGPNGYQSPQILDCLENVNRARELNWCQFVLRCLVKHTEKWQKSKTLFYTGPILFLILFYVDRCVLGFRTVARSIPAIMQWTNTLMLERERMEINKGGFGQGFLDFPCKLSELHDQNQIDLGLLAAIQNEQPAAANEPQPPIANNTPRAASTYANILNEPDQPAPQQWGHRPHESGPSNAIGDNEDDEQPDSQDIHQIEINLIKLTKTVYKTYSEIMELMTKVPKNMLENPEFRKMVERALVIERTVVVDNTKSAEPKQQVSQIYGEEFWNQPEIIAALAEIEEVAIKREAFKKLLDDVPSYSHGLNLTAADRLYLPAAKHAREGKVQTVA